MMMEENVVQKEAMPEKIVFTGNDTLAVNTIRVLSAEMVQRANSGHPGMPMGFALSAHVLWSRFLRFNPDDPFWPGRDRFILSAGHGSALLYSLLHIAGFDLQMDEIKRFRQMGSRTNGHPEFGVLPGVETTTGPLGQGITNAVGMALAQEHIRARLGVKDGFDPLDHKIYVVAGDGDLQEGVSNEAIAFAGHQQLSSLVVLYDNNKISIDGSTDIAWSENVFQRFEAAGWRTLEADGTDMQSVYSSLLKANEKDPRPCLISVRTHIGFGSPHKQDSEKSHGSPLGEEELELTKKQLGWNYSSFTVPDEVYGLYASVADQGRAEQESWEEKFGQWVREIPERAGLWATLMEGKMPDDWDAELSWEPQSEGYALRAASGVALNKVASHLPSLMGGCADLSGSVKTTIKDAGWFQPDSREGRNIHFGIREHAMGSIANGIALYGSLHPFTGTFLVFSDYMRPSLRMAALMKLPVIFVFSHDSIGVGEDGPTHQPVEHYAALRAIPNLFVFRPGDGAETCEAWRTAVSRPDGPSAILTSRQKVPEIDRQVYAPAEDARRGGYVLYQSDEDRTPDLVLFATGTEMHLALEAALLLNSEGTAVRVVSMPCMELFEMQPDEYREKVLSFETKKRAAIECGIPQGWHRYIGSDGLMIGMETFGESAPGDELLDKYGFTLEKVVQRLRDYLIEGK